MERADFLTRIQSHLDQAMRLRLEAQSDPLNRHRDALRHWQAARLASTYDDLRAAPRYQAAMAFFLSDLYGTGDLSKRDAQLSRALPSMIKLLPGRALEPLAVAIELDALCERLDREVIARLIERPEAGPTNARAGEPEPGTIDASSYGGAYRAAGTRADRVHQIDLIVRVGQELEYIARSRMIATTIMLMRGPARQAGFDELQSFLERGLIAFRGMNGATEFLATVRRRELAISDRLYASHPDPFSLPPDA